MNKYLEALERLAMPDELHIKECEKLGIGLTEDYEVVKQALLELQSIKEANPSEALKCLEDLYCEPVDYRSNDKANDYETIKQALLKVEKEQKQYLKWEDLKKDRTYKVLLNGNKYELVKSYDDYEYHCDCITLQKNPSVSIFIYEYEKEIFNDLHLEVLE